MILAAGLSERMNGESPKQVLPIGESTMVGTVVAAALGSRADRTVVVTGYHRDAVVAALAGFPVELVHNPDPARGNMSSFRIGAEALASCEAVMVLLSDMPGVDATIIDRMIEVWRAERPWAARASYRDRDGHPLLLSRRALAAVSQWQGPKGLWRFLAAAPEGAVARVRFAREQPVDVNTAADYEALRDAMKGPC